jgi:2-methylcitrate dehydratase PrpD
MPEMISLSRRLVRAVHGVRANDLPEEVRKKVKLALLDYLSCVFESLNLPQSVQAMKVVGRAQGGPVTVIGTPLSVSAAEAAFVNAILGHGLVREDMHTASVSHLGVVIFPSLLALSQSKIIQGSDFLLAAVSAYEVGASVGRALMDAETVRVFRPTGITGPIGAAAGCARMLDLTESASVSAIGFAANTTIGLNEWPRYGADEMFFHAGFAARNAVTAVELAELGAHASETALDGPAGLFASLGRADRVSDVLPFNDGQFEVLDVFHKPVGACNYAQTATQAALALATEEKLGAADIASVRVRCTAAALNYPGCNASGPFERVLQAKMSIRYCVASTLVKSSVEENNFRVFRDPEIQRVMQATVLEEDETMTQAYPKAQGSEVIVTLRNGKVLKRYLYDLKPASESEVRARYQQAASAVLGRLATEIVEATIDTLEDQQEIGVLSALLAAK